MGFIRFLPLRSSTTSTRYTPWSTGNAAVGTENGARSFLPIATTIREATARCTTAVTGTQRYDIDFQVALSISGATMQLTSATGSGLTVRATLGASLPAIISAANASAQRHLVSVLKQNSPPNQDTRVCWDYTVANEDDLAWFGAGDSDSAVTMAGTDRFMAFEWSGTATASTTTESVAQVAWPATGTFKRLLVRYISTASDFTLALRKNGADVLTLACPAGSQVAASDLTTQVSVTKGDLMCWRFARTSGAATSVQFYYVIGFSGTAA